MMPLSEEIYQFKALSLESFKGLPGLLSDSLPDRYGCRLIDNWLAAQGRSKESFTIIERLCYIGKRGIRALEFSPSTDSELQSVDDIKLNDLVKLSDEIMSEKINLNESNKRKFTEIIKVGTSAGGARAKAIIAYNEKTGETKSGQIDAGEGFSYWLVKLDGVKNNEATSFTRLEYAYYLMATDAKINMSESKLVFDDGRYHFMTKRFDRKINEKGKMEKLHMQTLGAMAHIDYNEPRGISYEETTHIMEKLGIKLSENKQFFRRMVFNVMARNLDDHVKNISFLMNRKGEWVLSPAYDITYSFNPKSKWTNKHQMTINSKSENFSKDDLLKSAKAMKIKNEEAIDIIKEVAESISKWPEYGKQASLDNEKIQFIKEQFLVF